ncbi:hypothetical protein ACH5RR_012139 [Cinchona calisaya]|uniref:Alcohol dehydrogenase-like N-terminal domain-containing protein n=1 Tax=Cinchona calisaya TaxID=153742 RepID=A0ABD3A8H3_9GENT
MNEAGLITLSYQVDGLIRQEMVGTVTEVGSKVTKCQVGDTVGMGCLCGSCRTCEQCKNDVETYCAELKMTYLSVYYDGTPTQGGYSNERAADEHFIINWPENLPLAAGAPLLCGGASVYSPMKYYGLDKPGTHLGIVGLGGLGHVAVKFAKAFWLKVTVIGTSPSKRDEAINQLGADNFLVSHDLEAMKAAR